ncbi:MAG TPA: DUF998 domain-containing protein [Gemmatimonadaceae bacterium]|nr:DUF998 domain-containing protein [Gemmatimonadaceae bacterium]
MPAAVRSTIRIGAIAWLLAVQFFVAQVVVATAWPRPFSLRFDYISDLGNTVCGPYPAGSTHLVCSPWHLAMNVSFMVLGVTMILGAWLTRDAFPPGWVRTLARVLFAVAGVGVFVVGVYPENTDNERHVLGAGFNFVAGNIAMIVYGLALAQRPSTHRALMIISILAGVLGMLGTLLFITGHFLGIGLGGMERVAAYPMTVWQMVAGASLLARADTVMPAAPSGVAARSG